MRAALPLLLAPALVAAPHAGPKVPQVQERALRAHLAFLSDDLLEGRGTGQRGGDLTVRYLETQLQALGLKPGNGASYRQAVRIEGVKTLPEASSLAITGKGEPLRPAFGADVVFGTSAGRESVAVDAPMVFVGYGVTAPEERWDDFKGLDLTGKVLVMMVNDPQPTAQEPERFGGKSLTYYGRWTYKFEEAKRRGAVGALLIHTTPSASYGWSVVQNGWTGERFQLAEGAGLPVKGWMTEATARALFARAGLDLDQERAKAESRDFRPVELGQNLQGTLASRIRTVDQYNVAGVVPGTDPKLKDEVVIYSAHWDHLGIDQDLVKAGKDGIYNGAVDNGSGAASLLAMAQAAAQRPAKRSQMFLFVCAEEQGLIGSEAYGKSPLWPVAKTAAALNLDSTNWVGATRDVDLPGADRSSLGAAGAAVAKAMGLTVAKPEPDLSGGYFRSDHFAFAKAGIPAFSIEHGRDYVKDPAGSRAKAEGYGQRYHQVTDEYDPAWDLSGMVQQAQYTLNLGMAVADAPAMPTWKPGSPFQRPKAAAGAK